MESAHLVLGAAFGSFPAMDIWVKVISCVYTRANIVRAKYIPGYFSSDYIRVASTLHYAITLRTLAALT